MTVLLLYDIHKKSKKDTNLILSRNKHRICNYYFCGLKFGKKKAGHSKKVNKLEYMLKNSMTIKIFYI